MLQISADLLAMSSDAALLIKKNRIAFANSAAFRLLGKDCVGKRFADLFGEDIAGIQADTFVAECSISKQDHTIRVCSDSGMRAVFISPVKEQLNLISDAFIFSLRNSLMSIETAIEVLKSDPGYDGQQFPALSIIKHECKRIVRFLSNITVIRAYENGEICLNPVSFDLSRFIQAVCDSVNSMCGKVELRFTNPGPVLFNGDRVILECLLLNLISNCLIHAHGCSRLSINLIEKGDRVMLSLDDDGCGIEADSLHSIFDRYRHSFCINDINRGAGLGLTAARIAAKVHGGTILMESRPGLGTAVRVSMSKNPFIGSIFKAPDSRLLPETENLLTGLVDCFTPEEFAAASAE